MLTKLELTTADIWHFGGEWDIQTWFHMYHVKYLPHNIFIHLNLDVSKSQNRCIYDEHISLLNPTQNKSYATHGSKFIVPEYTISKDRTSYWLVDAQINIIIQIHIYASMYSPLMQWGRCLSTRQKIRGDENMHLWACWSLWQIFQVEWCNLTSKTCLQLPLLLWFDNVRIYCKMSIMLYNIRTSNQLR